MIEVEKAISKTKADVSCCTAPDVPILSENEADHMARVLKAIAHPIRLQMMHLLSQVPRKLCVCEIEGAFDVKQPTISHHLRILKEAGLVESEQRGLFQYYRVCPDAVSLLRTHLGSLIRT